MALQLGVSYLPLAEVCIDALQAWTHLLPHDVLHQHLPAVLPLLLPYLRSKGDLILFFITFTRVSVIMIQVIREC